MHNSTYDYRTTFAVIPAAFPDYERVSKDLVKIRPWLPKGEGWHLASSTTVTNAKNECTVLYFWKRLARDRGFPQT